MDKTDCLELPFPECDPPLVKDASDIVQFKALADATNAAVQEMVDELNSELLAINAVNVTGNIVTTQNVVTHTFGNVPTINNGNMVDFDLDVIQIQRDGWYAVGGWVSANHASLPASIGLRIEPLVNNATVTSRQGPGQPAVGDEYVAWTDVLFLRQGDKLNCQTYQNAVALNVTYTVLMWAILVVGNV